MVYYHKEINKEGEGPRSSCQPEANGRRRGNWAPGTASEMRLKREEGSARWTGREEGRGSIPGRGRGVTGLPPSFACLQAMCSSVWLGHQVPEQGWGERQVSPCPLPTSQKNVISTVTVFTLSRTSSIEKCSN